MKKIKNKKQNKNSKHVYLKNTVLIGDINVYTWKQVFFFLKYEISELSNANVLTTPYIFVSFKFVINEKRLFMDLGNVRVKN